MFKKIIAGLLIVGAAEASLLNCIGGFTLTKKIHNFNMGIGNQWLRWLVFLVLVIIPVYGLAIFLDAILFNSIEFWTGSNPVAYDASGENIQMEMKGEERMVVHRRKFGEEMTIHIFEGFELKKAFLLKKNEPGVMYALKGDGAEKIQMSIKETDETVSVQVSEGDKIIHTENMTRLAYIGRLAQSDKLLAGLVPKVKFF